MVETASMSDLVHAYHCKNSLNNVGPDGSDFSPAFGNMFNAARCGMDKTVKWHLVRDDPPDIADQMIYDGIVFIRDKSGKLYQKIKSKVKGAFAGEDRSVDFVVYNTVYRPNVEDRAKALKAATPEIKKQERSKIVKDVKSVVRKLDEINSDETVLPSNTEFYKASYQTVIDSAELLLNGLGEHKLATCVGGVGDLIKISSGIESIVAGGFIGTTFGVVGAAAGAFSLVKRFLDDDDDDDGGGMAAMISQLSGIIIAAYNGIMNRLYVLEQNMNIRFDRIESTLEKNHLREYAMMRDIYTQGGNILFYMKFYHGEVTKAIDDVKTTITASTTELKQCMSLVTDNLNSFRFEKVNEILAEVDYDMHLPIKTSKIHGHLAKMRNLITNVLTNDHITGRKVPALDIDSKLLTLRSTSFDQLVNYFAAVNSLKSVVNPLVWAAVANYTMILLNHVDDTTGLKLLLRAQHSDYIVYVESMRAVYDGIPDAIAGLMTSIPAVKHRFVKSKQEAGLTVRLRVADTQYRNMTGELTDISRTSPFNHYTDTINRMKKSTYGVDDCGVPVSTGAICRRYQNNYSSSSVPFVKYALDNPTAQFCGSHSDNHKECGMHRNLVEAPFFTSGTSVRSAINDIATKPSDHIQRLKIARIDELTHITRSSAKVDDDVSKSALKLHFRQYITVRFKDVTVKVPLPSKLELRGVTGDKINAIILGNLGEFVLTVAYYDNDSIIEEVASLSFAASDGSVHDCGTVKATLTENIPAKINNNYETMLDLVYGGVMATRKDTLNVKYRTWNHDGYNSVETARYAYPSQSSVLGMLQRGFIFTLTPAIISYITTIARSYTEDMDNEFARSTQNKEIQSKIELQNLHRTKLEEIISVVENPTFRIAVEKL